MNRYILILLIILSPSVVFGVPPLNPEYQPDGPTCFLNKEAAQKNLSRLNNFPISAAALTNPSVLVIRVDFNDDVMTANKTQTESFFEAVQAYFSENSYGVFVPTFTVSNLVHRIGNKATYGADCSGDIACNDIALRNAAISAEDPFTLFTLFDHIMIYHAGFGQESTNVANDIWSVFYPGNYSVDLKTFSGFTIVPEKEAGGISPLGVICHEYGHQLGLPDLYDTSFAGGLSTIGAWDLMDFPYTADTGDPLGSNPSHLSVWSKAMLGFLTPQILNSSINLSQMSSTVSSQTYQVPVLISDKGIGKEYFLIEYRNASSTGTYDKGLPGSGILIWHIDNSIAGNPTYLSNNIINAPALNGQNRRGVDLVEADSTAIYTNTTPGQAGDAFGNGASFLTPKSDSFAGIPTGIVLTGISGVGTAMVNSSLEIPEISSFTTSSSVSITTQIATSNGNLTIQIPAGAFPAGLTFTYSVLSTTSFSGLGSASFVGSYSQSGVGIFARTQEGIQPSIPLSLTVGYGSNGALSALSQTEAQKLTLGRYVEETQKWVPISSIVNHSAQQVQGSLNHLSFFQILQSAPAANVDGVRIFPNPMRPQLGPTYQQISFSNLPVSTKIKILTLRGAIVKEIVADSSGLAVWYGNNADGNIVASGVYLAVIEEPGGSNRVVKKIAVER